VPNNRGKKIKQGEKSPGEKIIRGPPLKGGSPSPKIGLIKSAKKVSWWVNPLSQTQNMKKKSQISMRK